MQSKIITILLILFSATTLNAQTVDEILTTYFENVGGMDKWKELKSTKITAEMSMGPMEFPGVIYEQAPNLQKVEVNVQGKQIIQAYDGTTAWWINPFQGGEEAQKMPDEMAEDMVTKTFESDFINYKEKGHTLELEGKEEVEGAETFKVKLTKKDGDVEYHFFDTEYFIPIMTRTKIKAGPQKGQLSETYLSDFQEVDGLMFPFFIENKMAGETIQKITIKEVVLNETKEQSFFDFPKGGDMEKEGDAKMGEKADKEVAPDAAGDAKDMKEDAKEDMKMDAVEKEKGKKKKKKKKGNK